MSRTHYARQKHLLGLLKEHPGVELQLVVGGAAMLDKYGERFLPAIERDGFTIHEKLFNVIDGGNHLAMAKTAGLTALEFSNALAKLNPDIVLIRGDRFEQLASTMSAAYLNKTVAHIEGGDVTGTIDESVRHAITKLSHIHFVTNEDAKRRVIQMGEDPARVYNVGSLDTEFVSMVNKTLLPEFINSMGVGAKLDLSKPYIMVMQHPVTTETDNRKHTEQTIAAVEKLGMQALWFWPNHDAGTDEVSKALRSWREGHHPEAFPVHFVTDVLPEDFTVLLAGAACLVGNSSSGIKEASFLGVPVVNIGTRQANRTRGPNVMDAPYDTEAIHTAITAQVAHGPFPRSEIYYQPNTSKKIVEVLANTDLYIQKKFYET